jgi:hypothetical protein
MEAGREMRCDEVVWAISEADGRVVRKREIQAHLRSCADCRAFQDSIPRRRGELRAITPLPIAASTAIIQGALGAGSGTAGGSIAAAGGGAGKALLGSTVVKTAATCAVVAAIGTTAADRSGLVNFPIGVGADSRVREIPTPAAEPTSTHPHQTTKAARPPGSTAARHAARLHRHIAASKTAAAIGSAPGGGSSPAAGPTGNPSPAPEAAGRSAHGGAKPKKNAAKQGQGKAPGLPSSSAHGQQTAAAHKSPHGNAMPGTHQGAANGHSSPPPPAQPTVEPKPEKAAEPPAYGKGGNSAARATGRPTAEAEAEAEAETSG